VDFLTSELMPWVRERWRVSEDPARVIAAGQSYGGLASAFAALRSPDVFGNVLGQSTSCFWKDGSDFDLESEWLTREFVRCPKVPIRLYLEAGLIETGRHSIVGQNRHLRDVLRLQGYELTYHEFNGGHDYLCWRGGLADGLIGLTAGWPKAGNGMGQDPESGSAGEP
jgi:enterochelin esterase family protein